MRTGETAQWFRPLALLIQCLAHTGWLTIFSNSTSRGSDALFWHLRALQAHRTHANIWPKHSYIENKSKLFYNEQTSKFGVSILLQM